MQAHSLLALVLVTGCASPAARGLPRPADLRPVPRPTLSQPVDSILALLSTRQRVGQLVVPWLAGSYSALDDSLFQVATGRRADRSEEHTSELQSRSDLVCRLLLEKKKKIEIIIIRTVKIYS